MVIIFNHYVCTGSGSTVQKSLLYTLWMTLTPHVTWFRVPFPGATVCSQSDIWLAVLLHGHHHCPQPHLWCYHWHLRWPEEWKTEERRSPEDHLLHLRWDSSADPWSGCMLPHFCLLICFSETISCLINLTIHIKFTSIWIIDQQCQGSWKGRHF